MIGDWGSDGGWLSGCGEDERGGVWQEEDEGVGEDDMLHQTRLTVRGISQRLIS